MTVWDKHLGHPFHPQLQRQPTVDLLATHGHRLLGKYRSTRAPPLRHREDRSEARVLLGPHQPPDRRDELAHPELEALGLSCTCRLPSRGAALR